MATSRYLSGRPSVCPLDASYWWWSQHQQPAKVQEFSFVWVLLLLRLLSAIGYWLLAAGAAHGPSLCGFLRLESGRICKVILSLLFAFCASFSFKIRSAAAQFAHKYKMRLPLLLLLLLARWLCAPPLAAALPPLFTHFSLALGPH